MPILTPESLQQETKAFSLEERTHSEPSLFGVTDGKKVGTYLELKFRKKLASLGYDFEQGNAANGLDFPDLLIDMKTTSIKQPQSSCPFRSIRQKIYGLGYSLLIFVYDKEDDHSSKTSILKFTDTLFVEANRTGDFQMTFGLRDVLDKNGNEDDLLAFMISRHLTADEIELINLAAEVMQNKPEQGYLTISPAMQWRLQYKRVIELAGMTEGVLSLYKAP